MEVYVTADELKKSKNKVIQKMVELYGDKLEKVFGFEDDIVVFIKKETDIKLFVKDMEELLNFSEGVAYLEVDGKKYYFIFLPVNNELLLEIIFDDKLSKKYEQKILKEFEVQDYKDMIKDEYEEKNYPF